MVMSALNQVVQSASSLCEDVIHNVKGEIREALQDIGLPEADTKTVLSRLASAGVSHNPFEGLMTEYKQVQYYKENFSYLVSIQLYKQTMFVYTCISVQPMEDVQ